MSSSLLNDRKPIWCKGCGLYTLEALLAQVMADLEFNRSNSVLVSGIGCSGRFSGYFALDSVHTTHGRAIPVAEGIKTVRDDLNVVVVSGDGDLLSIGGNHLLHSIRRNTNITVICNRNDIYGMTGGQSSPTTPLDWHTKTSLDESIGVFDVFTLFDGRNNGLFARSSTVNPMMLKDVLRQALTYDGFAFVDVISPCVTEIARITNVNSVGESIQHFKAHINKHNEEGDRLFDEFIWVDGEYVE